MTPVQKRLFDYLRRYLADNEGVAPSFDQMKDALGLASKARIRILLEALEEQGYISAPKNRARRIEILRLPNVPAGPQAPKPLAAVTKIVSMGAIASHIANQPWCRADLETVLNSLRELQAMEQERVSA